MKRLSDVRFTVTLMRVGIQPEASNEDSFRLNVRPALDNIFYMLIHSLSHISMAQGNN